MNPKGNGEGSLAKSIDSELVYLLKEVSADIKQRNDMKRYLVQMKKAFDKPDIAALGSLLAQKNKRNTLAASFPTASDTLEKLSLYFRRESEETFTSLSRRFKEYCEGQKVSLRGAFPKLTVDNLLEIELLEEKHSAKIGTTFLRTLEWEKIRTAIEQERKRIWARDFDAHRFGDELIAIHAELIRIKPNPVGWVRLEDVYQTLKDRIQRGNPNWKGGGRLVAYYKDEFSADLSKLWRAQASQKFGFPKIELSGIRDPRLSYKIVLPDGKIGSYGHIRPDKE
jgi:hypothetical protein